MTNDNERRACAGLGSGFLRRFDHRRALTFAAFSALLLGSVIPIVYAGDVPHHFEDGAVVVADEINANFDDLSGRLDGLELANDERFIDQDTTITITVADGCDGLKEQLRGLERRRIVDGATVRLELEPGVYSCSETIEVDHPDGHHLQIRGMGVAPDDVVLSFPPSSSGITVEGGRTLGLLYNIALDGGHEDGAGWTAGILVIASSSLVMNKVVVRHFQTGVTVSRQSRAFGLDVTATENADWGFVSNASGALDLTSSTASLNRAGYLARAGSTMSLTNCAASGHTAQGFMSDNGGVLLAGQGVTSQANQTGFVANSHSTMILTDANATNNDLHGYWAGGGAYLRLNGASMASGNGLGATNMPPNVPNATNGAVIEEL